MNNIVLNFACEAPCDETTFAICLVFAECILHSKFIHVLVSRTQEVTARRWSWSRDVGSKHRYLSLPRTRGHSEIFSGAANPRQDPEGH